MVRAPCCERMGLKKGPWTPEEDQILISYIQNHGHGNWRALPKLAGLLRCGKSCRLRWVNYLRPDIKRGNFTKDEEETIIMLHEKLGNRWSAIAAILPGRTDNEIKNVWHTHLKKKLVSKCQSIAGTAILSQDFSSISSPCSSDDSDQKTGIFESTAMKKNIPPGSPQRSCSTELSSCTYSSVDMTTNALMMSNDGDVGFVNQKEEMDSTEYFPEIDQSFWQEEPSADDHEGFFYNELESQPIPFPESEITDFVEQFDVHGSWNNNNNNSDDSGGGKDFWYDLFIRAGNISELPQF